MPKVRLKREKTRSLLRLDSSKYLTESMQSMSKSESKNYLRVLSRYHESDYKLSQGCKQTVVDNISPLRHRYRSMVRRVEIIDRPTPPLIERSESYLQKIHKPNLSLKSYIAPLGNTLQKSYKHTLKSDCLTYGFSDYNVYCNDYLA